MDSASPIAARTAERPSDGSGAPFGFAMFTSKLADDGNRTRARTGWLCASVRTRLPHHPSATGDGRAR